MSPRPGAGPDAPLDLLEGTGEPGDLEPFPHAWLVALVAWDHDAHAHLAPRREPSGVVRSATVHPAVLLAVVRALGEPSPLDVTAAELAGALEGADLTPAQRREAPAALASFTAWACARGVLEGEALPAPTAPPALPAPAPSPLRLLRRAH